MLKNLKPVSLILIAGALGFSGSAYADLMPSKQSTGITQQNGRVTGVVEDNFGPVAGASICLLYTSDAADE